MPPPKRNEDPKRRVMMSVYPPAEVGVILGRYASSPFTQGLRCWAHLVEQATVENARAFQAREWGYLAHVTRGREWDPDWGRPGDLLGEACERAHTIGRAAEGFFRSQPDVRVHDLAERLRALTYYQAWAVIIALQYRDLVEDTLTATDAWWTIAHRVGRSMAE